MKRYLLVLLTASCCAFAQVELKTLVTHGPDSTGTFAMVKAPAPVLNAPYTATVTNNMVQVLSDGTRITQTSSGTMARDSQGRSRQDIPAPPAIGNLSASDAPHLVFIHDPVAQVTYTLNLTDKTAWKMPIPPASGASASPVVITGAMPVPAPAAGGEPVVIRMQTTKHLAEAQTLGLGAPGMISTQMMPDTQNTGNSESLGTETMEGLAVAGTRLTSTIPAGQIGNDRPIHTVSEIWRSPDLEIIVSSKRTDPRSGEQTMQLTNISRAEPDPALFTVPSDFKMVDGPQNFVYKTRQ